MSCKLAEVFSVLSDYPACCCLSNMVRVNVGAACVYRPCSIDHHGLQLLCVAHADSHMAAGIERCASAKASETPRHAWVLMNKLYQHTDNLSGQVLGTRVQCYRTRTTCMLVACARVQAMYETLGHSRCSHVRYAGSTASSFAICMHAGWH